MLIDVNEIYESVFTSKCRYFHFWGGRGRGGTHFATQYFLHLICCPEYFRGGFFRATFGQIKLGLWAAMQARILDSHQKGFVNLKDFAFNKAELLITFLPNGNSIVCKGFRASTLEEQANMKGIEGLTHVLIDEAEDVNFDEFNKVDDTIRTTQIENIQVILLFNPPPKNHWVIKQNYDLVETEYPGWYKAVKKPNPHLHSVHSTYLDNTDNLNISSIQKYRNYGNPNSPYYNLDMYYRNSLGLISEGKEGRIFVNVNKFKSELFTQIPLPEFYGIDFGFNHPNVLVGIKFNPSNNNLYVHQYIYENNLTKNQFILKIKGIGFDKTFKIAADSSEPDTIKEMNMSGLNTQACLKGVGSIDFGYRQLLNCNIFYTDSSKEIEQCFENHSWKKKNQNAIDDDVKNLKDEPEDDFWKDGIDAIRYAYTTFIKRKSFSLISEAVPATRLEVFREQQQIHNDDIEDILEDSENYN